MSVWKSDYELAAKRIEVEYEIRVLGGDYLDVYQAWKKRGLSGVCGNDIDGTAFLAAVLTRPWKSVVCMFRFAIEKD